MEVLKSKLFNELRSDQKFSDLHDGIIDNMVDSITNHLEQSPLDVTESDIREWICDFDVKDWT